MTIDLKYMESVIQAARDGKLAITRHKEGQVDTEAYERHVRHAVDMAVAEERKALRERRKTLRLNSCVNNSYKSGWNDALEREDELAALDAREKEGR